MKIKKNITIILLVMIFNVITSSALYKLCLILAGSDGKPAVLLATAFSMVWLFGAISSCVLGYERWDENK